MESRDEKLQGLKAPHLAAAVTGSRQVLILNLHGRTITVTGSGQTVDASDQTVAATGKGQVVDAYGHAVIAIAGHSGLIGRLSSDWEQVVDASDQTVAATGKGQVIDAYGRVVIDLDVGTGIEVYTIPKEILVTGMQRQVLTGHVGAEEQAPVFSAPVHISTRESTGKDLPHFDPRSQDFSSPFVAGVTIQTLSSET